MCAFVGVFVLLLFQMFNWCYVFTLFRAYLALFYSEFSHSDFNTNSPNIEIVYKLTLSLFKRFSPWNVAWIHTSIVEREKKNRHFWDTGTDTDRKKERVRVYEFNLKSKFTVYINLHTLNFIAWKIEAKFIALLFCVDHGISEQNYYQRQQQINNDFFLLVLFKLQISTHTHFYEKKN